MEKGNLRSLSDILGEFSEQKKIKIPLQEARIVNLWKPLMGELINRYKEKIFVKNQVLFIQVQPSALKNELLYLQDQIIEKINKSSQLNLSVLDVVYLKGEIQKLDEFWKKGVLPENIFDKSENKYNVIMINQILDKSIKKLPECRGMVTADYQTHLETEWKAYLENKYKVSYFDEVLKTIK